MSFAVLAVLASFLCASTALAAERVALVIGNSQYQHAGPLPNTKNDASDVAKALEARGFSVEAPLLDASKTAMDDALARFARRAVGAQQAVVFFAGHGIEVAGQNYLLPVDAELATSRTVEFEAVKLSSVLNAVGGARQFGMVVLDACRNNPFVPRLAASDPVWARRSVDRGLARIEPEGNVLVAYAAEAGTTAADSAGAGARNSPFTVALLEALRAPPKDVRLMLGGVRDRVMAMTASGQKPFTYGSLGGGEVVLGKAASPRRIEPEPVEVITDSTPPGGVFRDRLSSGGEGPVMVVLPAGSFLMGSPANEPGRRSDEGPRVPVTVEAFSMGLSEVTRADFRVFVEQTGYVTEIESGQGPCIAWKDQASNVLSEALTWRRPGFDQGEDHPVVCVSWSDAQAYVAWLSRETGKVYRLPSEAEQEYAIRARTTTTWAWGSDGNGGCAYANGADTSFKELFPASITATCNDYFGFTAPAGTRSGNAFGLHDVSGNVSEWSASCYRPSLALAHHRPDDAGDRCMRVVRGGSWVSRPFDMRSSSRERGGSIGGRSDVGFRVVRSL